MVSIIVPFAVKDNNDVNLHNWPNQDIGYYIYTTIQCIKNIDLDNKTNLPSIDDVTAARAPCSVLGTWVHRERSGVRI